MASSKLGVRYAGLYPSVVGNIMSLNKLNVYPDSDFWPNTFGIQSEAVIDLSHIQVYKVKRELMVRLVDLKKVKGIIPPEADQEIQVA